MATVTRVEKIEGRDFPGIIHNGNHYLTRLAVYSDGMVSCWGLLDPTGFQEKLRRGWVTTGVPDGETLHVHHVGQLKVSHGEWERTPAELEAWVDEQVTMMNPARENLRDYGGVSSRKIGKVNYAWPLGSRIRPVEPGVVWVGSTVGEDADVLWRVDGELYVVNLTAFRSGKIYTEGLPEERELSSESLRELAASGVLSSQVDPGQWINIRGLGRFRAQAAKYLVPAADIVTQLQDDLDRRLGRTNLKDRCKHAYERWQTSRSQTDLDALREAYLAVPEHLRRYLLGDMDRKDRPIREVLGLD